MILSCNICSGVTFASSGIKPRKNAACTNCRSLERHRALYQVLYKNGDLAPKDNSRCLHLAPERATHDYLLKSYKSGYTSADLYPDLYKHAACLKLRLPEDFDIFPNGYFSLIVHNHVLEHIPGSVFDHIKEFHRLLAKDGRMVFSIPDYRIRKGVIQTTEGGEFLSSDKERISMHGQSDHYKTFGIDLIDALKSIYSEVRILGGADDLDFVEFILKHNAKGPIYYCIK